MAQVRQDICSQKQVAEMPPQRLFSLPMQPGACQYFQRRELLAQRAVVIKEESQEGNSNSDKIQERIEK